MAAPNNKTLKDLSGHWKMNRDLSSDPTPVLELQEVGIMIRKVVPYVSITLDIEQSGEGERSHILIDQRTTANIPAINEEWTLDWKEREQSDKILGKVSSKSRWRQKSEIDQGCLTEGLEEDEVIEAEVRSLERDWVARHVWGFAVEGGQRRFVRRVLTSSEEGKSVQTILVYDFSR